RRRHTRSKRDWSSDVCSSDLWLAHSGAIPIFMGGDHSLSMGSINGVARYWKERDRPLFALWVDAHADYNTPATTITGNMHGMSRSEERRVGKESRSGGRRVPW